MSARRSEGYDVDGESQIAEKAFAKAGVLKVPDKDGAPNLGW